jgi:Protein of unknown function (DUF3592)
VGRIMSGLSALIRGLVLALIGTTAILFGGYRFYLISQFTSSNDIRVDGIVDELRQGSGRSSGSTYSIAFHYLAEGDVIHSNLGSSAQDWYRLRIGSVLPVKYLKNSPEVSWIDLPSEYLYQKHQAIFAIVFGVIFECYGGYFFWKSRG